MSRRPAMRPRVAAAVLWILAAGAPAVVFAASGDGAFPRDVLKGIDAMKRLPADGFHVVESQGRLLLVSTNGHYVVTGGRIVDLWNELEVRSVADVERTLRIPLKRMGIDARALGGVSIGPADAPHAVTVFLDPASTESRKVLPPLRELTAKYRVEVVFVPAQPSRAGVSRALICDREAARVFLADARLPSPLPESEACGAKELERARITVHLLGIGSLPFSIASNGATLSGVPKDYDAFVTTNTEGP